MRAISTMLFLSCMQCIAYQKVCRMSWRRRHSFSCQIWSPILFLLSRQYSSTSRYHLFIKMLIVLQENLESLLAIIISSNYIGYQKKSAGEKPQIEVNSYKNFLVCFSKQILNIFLITANVNQNLLEIRRNMNQH